MAYGFNPDRSKYDFELALDGKLSLTGGTMTGDVILPSRSVSYIDGSNGDVALFSPKLETGTDQWNPILGFETKGGGVWTFGNYDGESFKFVYHSQSTIAAGTNAPDRQIQFNADGTTSGFNVTTSQVIDLLPTVLYNNKSGTTGNVTLSQSAANFTRLKVFFTTGNAGYSSVEVLTPDKEYFTCIGASAASSTIAQIEFCKCYINGTSITRTNGGYVNVATNSTAGATMTNQIKIVRVEGYKW